MRLSTILRSSLLGLTIVGLFGLGDIDPVAASIVESDFFGTYGDTVSFTATTHNPNAASDDGNPDTINDIFVGQGFLAVGSVSGVTDANPTFTLTSVDLDYPVAFPAPGVYVIDLFELVQGYNTVAMETQVTPVIFDSALITLAAVPEPSSIFLFAVGSSALAGLARRRRKR